MLPCAKLSSIKVFPCSAALAEESYDFEIPGPQTVNGETVAPVTAPQPRQFLRLRDAFKNSVLGAPNLVSTKTLSLKDPAVLKIPRVMNLLRVVNLLSHCDLLSWRTLCGMHFPENYRHFSSQRRVRGVGNMGGVVKTLRRSNSLFLLSS